MIQLVILDLDPLSVCPGEITICHLIQDHPMWIVCKFNPLQYNLAVVIKSDTEASTSAASFSSFPVRYALISGYPATPSFPIPSEKELKTSSTVISPFVYVSRTVPLGTTATSTGSPS